MLAFLKSKFALNDAPTRKVQKRLDIIEGMLAFFGFNTYSHGWKIRPLFVGTVAILVVSLIVDTRRGLALIENRANEKINDIVEVLVFISTQAINLCKVYKLIRYNDSFKEVIQKLGADFCKWNTDEKSIRTMALAMSKGWKTFRVGLLSLVVTTTFFVARSIKNHSLPSPASGFVIPNVDNHKSPYYEILFVLQMWIIVAQIATAFCYNSIFCTLAVAICGHIAVLGRQLGDTRQEGAVDDDEEETAEGFHGRITVGKTEESHDEIGITKSASCNTKDFIEKHIQIYEAFSQLAELFDTIMGLQPIYTGTVVVTSALLYDGSQQSNLFLQISFIHIIDFFMYCLYGDLVAEKSADLSFKLYSTPWYLASIRDRKAILQMMHRCQKPFTLNAGIFGPLTMVMFSKSMQMTYSIWTVLKGRAAKQ